MIDILLQPRRTNSWKEKVARNKGWCEANHSASRSADAAEKFAGISAEIAADYCAGTSGANVAADSLSEGAETRRRMQNAKQFQNLIKYFVILNILFLRQQLQPPIRLFAE